MTGDSYDDTVTEDHASAISNVSARVSAAKDALEDLRATSTYRQKKSDGESDDDAYASDLPRRWSARRVAAWLRSLGGWTAPFAARFEEEKTHGSILDALDADTLRERFGAADPRVRGALLDAVTRRFPFTTPTTRGDGVLKSAHHDDFTSMSDASRVALASLRDATASALATKSRGASTVSEDDAFDALREAATEIYFYRARSADSALIESARESSKDGTVSRELHDACLLACCDAHESRSSLGFAGQKRVDAARFASAAAETLHGEMDEDAATRRRRATAELDALETLSSADHTDYKDCEDHLDHVTPLILRAALETKLRARGVDTRGVFFSVSHLKRAVDDVVADGLLAGSGAAGARAAARFFEVSEIKRSVDDCVADMVRVAFARRAKSAWTPPSPRRL